MAEKDETQPNPEPKEKKPKEKGEPLNPMAPVESDAPPTSKEKDKPFNGLDLSPLTDELKGLRRDLDKVLNPKKIPIIEDPAPTTQPEPPKREAKIFDEFDPFL